VASKGGWWREKLWKKGVQVQRKKTSEPRAFATGGKRGERASVAGGKKVKQLKKKYQGTRAPGTANNRQGGRASRRVPRPRIKKRKNAGLSEKSQSLPDPERPATPPGKRRYKNVPSATWEKKTMNLEDHNLTVAGKKRRSKRQRRSKEGKVKLKERCR